MKRGFLLHHPKRDRIAVSQRNASTSPPLPELARTAHAAMVLHASALALLTREPAVLWLCRHQESRGAVQHFHYLECIRQDRAVARLLSQRYVVARNAPYSDGYTMLMCMTST